MPTVAYLSHSDCGRHDTGWGHPEHVGRLRAIPRALREDFELFAALDHREGRHATLEELQLVHDPAYLEAVRLLAESGGGQLDPETVVSEGSWAAATAGAGCLLDAVDLVLAGTVGRAFCAVRPPGHHALPDRGMGFCLVGNVGLAARYAQARHGVRRVLIVDWDVHHGNGTQAIVEREPDVRFVSMHQWPWYPGTGAAEDRGPLGTVWNVPLPPELPPVRYLTELEQAIDRATADWTPELVLVSAGFDCLQGDPLGGFTLRVEDVPTLTRLVTERADAWCGGRVVSSLEGGYDPASLGPACVAHMRALHAS